MPPRIITATIDQLDDIAPLFDAYRVFYQQPSDVAAATAFLRERLLLRESVIFLAYGEAGTPLGFTQLYPLFSSVGMRRKWLLNDLFVVPNVRGQRVGEALINRAIEHARQTGAASLMLQTAHTNISGQKLYERMSFVQDGEFRVYSLQI